MKLKINKEFAASYDKRRAKEELARLKSKYGDVSEDSGSSSSDSDIDEDNILTDTRELNVLNALTSADPRIKDPNYKWYSNSDSEQNEEEKEEDEGVTLDGKPEVTDRPSQSKGVYLRDVERLRLLKDVKTGKDQVKDEEMEDAVNPNDLIKAKPDLLALKNAFKEAAEAKGNSLFSLAKKTSFSTISSSDVQVNEDKSKEDLLLEYINMISNKKHQPQFDYNFMSDSSAEESGEDEEDEDDAVNEKEESSDSGDSEIFVARSSQKEVKSHPRIIPDSMRLAKKDGKKRSEKNREVRQRKFQEKEAKKAEIGLDLHKKVELELLEFKRLKKEVADDKINQIKRTAAVENIDLDAKELEDDWDPEKHEQMVQRMFGDEYEDEEELSKPVFSDDEEIDKDEVDWDQWDSNAMGVQRERSAVDFEAEEEVGGGSQEIDSGRGSGSRRRRRRRRLAGFRRAMERVSASGKIDVESGRYKKEDFPEGFDQFVEKVYELDCEDIILGRGEGQEDLRCRFKYRTVEPNDFGLSADEILSAPAKELNSWVSLKKITQIRGKEEEEKDKRTFASQRRQMQKSRLIPTVFVPVAADEKKSEDNEAKKGRKRKRKNKKKVDNEEQSTPKKSKRRIELDRVSESRISKLVRLK